jgi:hypothetical protein
VGASWTGRRGGGKRAGPFYGFGLEKRGTARRHGLMGL